MTKQTFIQKNNGDTLSASEWNELTSYVNTAVDAINEAGSSSSSEGSSIDSSFLYLNDKGNLCLETTAENTPANKKGKLNIESRDDIQIKPGDDIMLYGDHRGEGKTDEVSIKVMDGTGANDVPAKLQVNMSEITLTTKDKTGNDSNVLDININQEKNTKGYLKIRAQAIDLRCEDHGGIALQPKGEDSQHNMNKIKFEHGGGDGLEFGTFNTEHTSLFTGDYRFNKNGIIKLATRTTVASDKADPSDSTTAYKYVKQSDDFYDIIDVNDPTCTWGDILNLVAYAKTQGWISSQSSTTPVTITTDANNYTAYVGEDAITKINASSSPSVALTYTSDNSEVVTVDNLGNLEGIGTGTAHITITPTNSASYSGSKTVNVTVMPQRNTSLDLTIATEGNVPWSIPVNSSSPLVVEVTPVSLSSENAPCQLQWTAEPSGIVTYSALDAEEHRISVTPQSVGTVTLTATFSGNDNDAPADVSHTLTVTAAA